MNRLEHTQMAASTAPILIAAEAGVDWGAHRRYQTLKQPYRPVSFPSVSGWFATLWSVSRSLVSVASASIAGRYAMLFPPELPEPPGSPLTAKDIVYMDPVMQVGESGWIADGSALAPFAYLMTVGERTLSKDGAAFAFGHLKEGALTLGLIRVSTGLWAATVPINTPGPFAVSVQAPDAGAYLIVIANANPLGVSRVSASITDLRWQS